MDGMAGRDSYSIGVTIGCLPRVFQSVALIVDYLVRYSKGLRSVQGALGAVRYSR